MSEDLENEDFSANDFSIERLKENLVETNQILLENLKKRYTEELLGSMIFFAFNEICQMKNKDFDNSEYKNNTIAENFITFWSKSVKKQAKKEMLDINNKLKDNKMNFLGAISNFSLPSTEDYQLIYNQAISEIEKVFQKNTKI